MKIPPSHTPCQAHVVRVALRCKDELRPQDRSAAPTPTASPLCCDPVAAPAAIAALKSSARYLLEGNILPFWLNNMQDHENGGFYGRIDGHNRLHKDADKGAILNARILWTFSSAYRVFSHLSPLTPHLSDYLEAARRARDYFLKHFIDREYGGVYWSLDCTGKPKDTKKQFYAIGFAIYGLSEYARATGDREALEQAVSLYRCIEEHALDHEHNGYIEAKTRDWQPIGDMRLSERDANYPKSQNTHLHIIEPYTNLLRALRMACPVSCDIIASTEASLRNLITIFTDRILNPDTHHLDLFFNMDWSRGSDQEESYGHDIECSWLMHETALVLGDPVILKKVEPIVQMVARASEKGLRSLIPCPSPKERGVYSSADTTPTAEATTPLFLGEGLGGEAFGIGGMDEAVWWVQAEAVVGFLNIYQHFGDEAALQKALRCYEYIENNLVDREHGEWYWSRRADGTANSDDDKAGFWKCPYHNGRMCLEIIEREI